MAIIYSYPTGAPVGADKILGIDTSDASQTVVFTISSILEGTLPAKFSTASITTLGNFANDTAAASGGVAVNQLYRNGSVVQVRVS